MRLPAAGRRKEADRSVRRWGSQKGSVYLMDQKLSVDVPRVRDMAVDKEVCLSAYRALQRPREMDEGLLLRVLKGISCRNYRACAEAVPEAFGISASSVSRRFIKATAKKLKQFRERPLDQDDFVALFIDGKSFAEEEMVIALGVTIGGLPAAGRPESPCRLRRSGNRERTRLPRVDR